MKRIACLCLPVLICGGCVSWEYNPERGTLRVNSFLRDAQIGKASAKVTRHPDGTRDIDVVIENYAAEHKAVEALANLAGSVAGGR